MLFRITPMLKFILIINVAVFIINNLLAGSITLSGVPVSYLIMKYFALQPFDGIADMQFYPWQLITYQFMHADFSHIFFNMLALWMFSSDLEENWGSAKYVIFYLLAGIGAGITHLVITPILGHSAPTIGASGSLYGIIIAFAMLNPDRKIMVFPIFIPIPARIFGIGMMVVSAIMGFNSIDGVAHFAHFGGALTGLILLKFGEKTPIFKWARRYIKTGIPSNEYIGSGSAQSRFRFTSQARQGYKSAWTNSQTTERPQVVDTNSTHKQYSDIEVGGVKITQSQIDAILDKISHTGYQSLSEQEKYILTEISKKL